jgi:integrase
MGYIRAREGRYQANIRRKGYPTVTKTFTSREAAKSWTKATEIRMERGEFNPDSSITVEELIKRYAKEVVPKQSGSNPALYRCNTLRRMLGKHRVAELTPAILASYRDERLQTIQPNSLRREFGLLSAAINTAVIDWGISIPSNPVQFVRVPKFDDRRDRRLEDGEEEKLLNTAPPQYQRYIIVALETAMRRGELLRMRKSHIDFGKRTLLIPVTKNDKPRTIPLSTRAIKAIKDQLQIFSDPNVISIERDPLVFSFSLRMFRRTFDRIREKLHMKDWKPHDLRHEATSRLFEKGLNIMEVASITGHEDLKMLKRYTHIKPESLVARLG